MRPSGDPSSGQYHCRSGGEPQKVMRKEFKDIHKKMDMTVIYVTDNQETALALGTRMVVMNEGSICQDGTPEELAAHPANCFVGGVVGGHP